jgi:hypothetical protein
MEWHEDDEKRCLLAAAKSDRLHAAYLKQVADLRSRMSERTFARFADKRQPLFDSDLLEFAFGNALGYAIKMDRRRTLRTAVQAKFRSFDYKTLHFLTYKDVEALNANVPDQRWFDMGGPKKIDNLLADELTSVHSRLMQHSFLFASGATISIRFEHVRWETKRNR